MIDIHSKRSPLWRIKLRQGGSSLLNYSIYDGEQVVGEVQAEPQGMYYLLRCSCRPLSGKPAQIVLARGEGLRTDLGRCIPEGERLTLVKRIRKKELEGQTIKFEVLHAASSTGIKLEDDMQFAMLEKLPLANVLVSGDKLHLIFGCQSNSSPTGQ